MEIVYTYSLELLYSFENKEYEALNPEIYELINSREIRDYVTYKPSKQTTNFLFRNVEISDEEIIKRINGLLNKITENNFEKIYDKINSILKNDNIIDSMIDKVFDKAIVQTGFCKLYAQICAKFCNNQEEEVLSTSIKESLLRKCNEMYIECLQEDDYEKINTHNYEEFCKYMKNKKKLIGIFHFMGNLHKQKLASDKDISTYINLLVKKIKFYQKIDKMEQEQKELLENLCECLCKLLQTVHDSLEILKDLIELENQIKCFTEDEINFSPRIRFMFLDLQEIFKKLNSKPKYVAKFGITIPSSFSSKSDKYSSSNKSWKSTSSKDYSKQNKFNKYNNNNRGYSDNRNRSKNKEYSNSRSRNKNKGYSDTRNNQDYSNNRNRPRSNKGYSDTRNTRNTRSNRGYSDTRSNQDYYPSEQNDVTNTRKKYNKSQKKSYYNNSDKYTNRDTDSYSNDYGNSEYKLSNTYTRKYNSSSNSGYKRKKDNRKYKDSKKEYENSKNEKTEELKNKRFDILD
jgi:hypothetical protein